VADSVAKVAEVIGKSAKDLRLDAKVTLEQLARVAQRYGLPWTSGRVGDFEAGRTAPSLPTLIAAAAALGDAIGRPVSLAELVAGNGQVHINDKLSLDKSALHAALSGGSLGAELLAPSDVTSFLNSILQENLETMPMEISTVHWPKRLRAITPDLRSAVLRDFSESDARMCKNIGVSEVLGATAMAALWRRTFTAERDLRAGPDANAQRRGQISRRLKADIQEVINDGND
jgi:transcriptional regulator with XRE-family HTH domain